MKTKICTRCHKKKLLSKFYKNSQNKDGLHNKCKSCQSEYRKWLYYKDHAKYKYLSWVVGLRNRFGLTPEEWQQMYNKQKGCCAICGKHQSELDRRLDTHHLIINEKIVVIGLLCLSCNTGIGNFKHNIKLLEKAIKFIKEKHP